MYVAWSAWLSTSASRFTWPINIGAGNLVCLCPGNGRRVPFFHEGTLELASEGTEETQQRPIGWKATADD